MDGKQGGDCSDRFCPYELSWADGPTVEGETHNYAECAGKGVCDREKGECTCFEGYEGKACGRQSCPNDCSGHGTCQYMKDIKFGNSYHDYNDGSSLALSGLGVGGKKIEDLSWDSDRARACVCDAEWTGIDCMQRMCPVGNDIMDVVPSPEVSQKQTITLFDMNDDNTNFIGKTFALQFTSKNNQTFATQPIAWDTDDSAFATKIETALLRLPNRVIDDVAVITDQSSGPAGVTIEIEFIGDNVEGPQNKVEVLADKCEDGCTPLITGLDNLRSWHATQLSTVQITTSGSHISYECGNRGKCDRKNGLCLCYEGFTGHACGLFS